MRLNGSTAYSTVIASVNNRNATTAAVARNSPKNEDPKQPNEKVSKAQSTLSATIETTGRKLTLSKQVTDQNLPHQTRSALNSYVNIQNQPHTEEQNRNQQLLGIDLFV